MNLKSLLIVGWRFLSLRLRDDFKIKVVEASEATIVDLSSSLLSFQPTFLVKMGT